MLVFMQAVDRTGKKYGKLAAIRMAGRIWYAGANRILWECLCECGKKVKVLGAHLPSRKSCGCSTSEGKAWNVKHRLCGTPEYQAWADMRHRCLNPDHARYRDYGGRGITVCRRWNNFLNFLADMGKRTSPGHSLDRKNNNGGYRPGNCKWSTRSEQQRNRRTRRGN